MAEKRYERTMTKTLPKNNGKKQTLLFTARAEDRRRETRGATMKVVGLFAGIGGIELGLHRAGHETIPDLLT